MKKSKLAPKPRGGARPGAGRKAGGKNQATIEKELYREVLRQLVVKELEPMTAAQIAQAKGIKYLVVRDKRTGKFLRVPQSGAQQLDANEEIVEVWEKDPSTQAYADLLNRALDKPAEQMKVTGDDGGPVEHVFRWEK